MSTVKVKLNSRSGDNYLQRVEESNDTMWVLKSDVDYFQTTRDPNTGAMIAIDPSGGPRLCLGDKIKELDNKKIVRLSHFKNIGFVITVE